MPVTIPPKSTAYAALAQPPPDPRDVNASFQTSFGSMTREAELAKSANSRERPSARRSKEATHRKVKPVSRLGYFSPKRLLGTLGASSQSAGVSVRVARVTQPTLDGIRLDLSTLSLARAKSTLDGITSRMKSTCPGVALPGGSVLRSGCHRFIGLFCKKRIGIQQ